MPGFVNDMEFGAAWAEFRALLRSRRAWFVFAALCALLTLSGPFGTLAALSPLARLVYWAVLAAGAFAGGFLVSYCAASLAEAHGVPPWGAVICGGLAAAAPVAAWVAGLGLIAFGGEFWAGFLGILPEVALIGVLAGGLYEAFAARPPAATEPGTAQAFLAKLPPDVAADVVSIRAEDHYIRVASPGASALLLMPLGTAAEALAGKGLRVHRSWWVASHHVCGIARRNGALVVRLTGGVEVPVGRTYAAGVRARWGKVERASP